MAHTTCILMIAHRMVYYLMGFMRWIPKSQACVALASQRNMLKLQTDFRRLSRPNFQKLMSGTESVPRIV